MRISDWSSDVALPIYRSPGCSALNSPEPEGCQKLASSGAILSRKLNQGLCVTPTNILTTNITMTVWVPLAMSAFHNPGRVPAKPASGMTPPLLLTKDKIGRASCRERVCQYVSISVVAVSLKKKKYNYKE